MTKQHRMFLAAALLIGICTPAFAAELAVPPVIPAGETPAPKVAKTDAKKKSAATKSEARKAAEAPKLSNPEPAVAKQNNINVRGQAKINSEVVTHLHKGQLVTVLDEITLKKPGTDEPDKWAKIALPTNSFAWVNTSFLDANKSVVPKKLNLRSGPGENYSIVGRIVRGDTVNVADTKGAWSKIEAPAGSYAFVAAHLLSRDPSDIARVSPAAPPAPIVAVVTPPPPQVTTTIIEPAPVVAPPPTTIPTPPVVTPPPPPAPIFTPVTTTPAAPVEEILIKRVITREGIVRGSVSIQAPSFYSLRSLEGSKTINYLHSSSTNIAVGEFKGQRVMITGEEILDERWPNTPVIEIETIQAVEE